MSAYASAYGLAKTSLEEIHDQISKLGNKKAPGTETLLNEMIKYEPYCLVPSLERIFNDIITTGAFPTEWNVGVIKPICKNCPAKYSGITLTSCL